MIPTLRILTPAVIAAAAVSCSPHKADTYDTPPGNPYGAATPAASGTPAPTNPATAQTGNPIYDSPAAYEENAVIAPANPGSAPEPSPAEPTATAAATPPPANGAAIIHTVVKGDTLSGIAAKYKVPVASIKQANRMTNDTVVLDRKMVIPPR